MAKNLEWPHLQVFVATYEESGMARAAERLNVSPAYVTKIIKELETFLDVELFSRESNGVKPTDHANQVYAESTPLIEHFHRVQMQLQSLGEIRGEINIGVLPALPGTLLARAIDAVIQSCAKSHPQIRIKITEARGAGLIELLHQKSIDFAFLQIPPTTTTIESTALLTEHLMLIADKERLKDVEKIKSAASLSKFPLIFQTARGSMRTLIETVCASEGYSLTPILEIDSIGVQLQLCVSGQGACILPASACLSNDFLAQVKCVPITIPGVSRTLYFSRNANYLSPQANVVSDLLNSHIEAEVRQLTSTKLIRFPQN